MQNPFRKKHSAAWEIGSTIVAGNSGGSTITYAPPMAHARDADFLDTDDVAVNAGSLDTGLRGRIAAAVSGGYDFADTLHNIYLDYGYPASLDFSNYWNMYRRFGIAKNVVDLPVNTGWSTPPAIESSDAMMKELDKLSSRIPFWIRLKGLDLRQRVGRYGGLYMRVKDGRQPDRPIDGTLPGEAALFDIIPLYESQLEVVETDEDHTSETYGQPIMFEYRGSVEGDRNENTSNTIKIHASRVVIAAEGADDGTIYGISALEPVYNSLMDLRKIIGAGGEGFYKNAAQSIVFNLKDGASASQNKDLLNDFNESYDDFVRNRSRRAMWTPGMEAKTLESSLTNPKEFFTNALNDVAAGTTPMIPATILIGQQTGRFASGEDSDSFLAGNQSRRENFLTGMTSSVINWMIKFGILPAADYEVVWDDLLARSDKERLDNADKMASVNEKQFKSGGDVPFSGGEIREAAGFEPDVELDDMTEELDDEVEE